MGGGGSDAVGGLLRGGQLLDLKHQLERPAGFRGRLDSFSRQTRIFASLGGRLFSRIGNPSDGRRAPGASQPIIVRVPNPLAFGSGLGERTPKKAIFQLWRSVSQSKKILHQKAQQNWNQSSMTFKFCQFETILKVSSGHCGPLTPFLQFRHFSGSQCTDGFLIALLYFSPQIGTFPTLFVILQHAATT